MKSTNSHYYYYYYVQKNETNRGAINNQYHHLFNVWFFKWEILFPESWWTSMLSRTKWLMRSLQTEFSEMFLRRNVPRIGFVLSRLCENLCAKKWSRRDWWVENIVMHIISILKCVSFAENLGKFFFQSTHYKNSR